jgi:hypothetical protein
VIVNRKYLYLLHWPQTGLIDVRIGSGWSVRLMRRLPVDTPLALEFVRKSTYSIRLIIHPNGGNAMQMVCEECGASYPFNRSMQKFTPCAFCAVRRQSGVRVQFGKWSWEKVIEV